jgi:tetratricopeptide (TPR) repeat protein
VVLTETNKSTNGQGNTGNVNETVTDNLNTISNPDTDKDGYKSVTDSTKISVDMVLVQGKTKYNAKDYDAALVLFSQVLVYDPTSREALYYSGASYLAKNNPDLAIASYDKVIAQGKGLLYDDARYDKSLALLKKNKNEEAKKLLNDLIKEGGPYKTKASEKVK